MSIPRRVRANGRWWKIERPRKVINNGVECWGLTIPESSTIQIQRGLGYDEALDTLLHELLHVAFLGAAIRLAKEEDVVSRLTPQLLGILRDNALGF